MARKPVSKEIYDALLEHESGRSDDPKEDYRFKSHKDATAEKGRDKKKE